MPMTEVIEIKRKEFVVLEHLGEHSFKVERKGKIYFLKKYTNRDYFEEFVKSYRRLKITALNVPKLYFFDKNQLISVVDFIEGPTMLDELLKGDITNEEIYKQLLQQEWCMRRERIRIDFHPEYFKYDGKKLFYLPFIMGPFESNYNFTMVDFRLWFPTKQFSIYVKSKGLDFDDSRVGNEYAVNKQMALIAVKYYL